MKKFILLTLTLFVCLLSLSACKNTVKDAVSEQEQETTTEQFAKKEVATEPEKQLTYKAVEPTQAELDNMHFSLNILFSHFLKDYDSAKDNAYEKLFCKNELLYFYIPECFDGIKEFVSPPLSQHANGKPRWNESVRKNDPMGRFTGIPKEAFDENGVFDEKYYLEYYSPSADLTKVGYTVFDTDFIDWLVEGVWNGKVDHETVYRFKDYEWLYYFNDSYVASACGIADETQTTYYSAIEYVKPLDGQKYEVAFNVYHIYDNRAPHYYSATAVIGVKEASNGFRFWSIYNTDYEKTRPDDNDLMSYGIPFGLFYEYGDSVIYPEKDDYSYIRINFDESREVSGYARLHVSTPGEADGYIDSNGKFYTELPDGGKCSYLRDWQNVDIPRPEGINQIYGSPYETSLYRFVQDNRYGYLNTDGEIVIEAQFYEASDFSEGLAAVTRELDGCLEYINESGETVIKLDGVSGYQNIFHMVAEEPSCDFSDGVALIYCGNESFCIDKDGNRLGVKNPVGMHKQGLIAFRDKDTELCGFADKDGNIVIPATYTDAYDFSSSGIALVYSTEKHYPPENYPTFLYESYYRGFIDTTGNVVIPLEFEQPFYLYGMKLFFESFESYGIVSLYKQGYTYYYRCDGTLLGKSPRMACVWYEQKNYPINVAEYWQWVNDGKPVG